MELTSNNIFLSPQQAIQLETKLNLDNLLGKKWNKLGDILYSWRIDPSIVKQSKPMVYKIVLHFLILCISFIYQTFKATQPLSGWALNFGVKGSSCHPGLKVRTENCSGAMICYTCICFTCNVYQEKLLHSHTCYTVNETPGK